MSSEMGEILEGNLPERYVVDGKAQFFARRLRRYQELMSLPFMFPHEAKLVRKLGKSTYWDLVWLGYQHLAEEILCNPIIENPTLERTQ